MYLYSKIKHAQITGGYYFYKKTDAKRSVNKKIGEFFVVIYFIFWLI